MRRMSTSHRIRFSTLAELGNALAPVARDDWVEAFVSEHLDQQLDCFRIVLDAKDF